MKQIPISVLPADLQKKVEGKDPIALEMRASELNDLLSILQGGGNPLRMIEYRTAQEKEFNRFMAMKTSRLTFLTLQQEAEKAPDSIDARRAMFIFQMAVFLVVEGENLPPSAIDSFENFCNTVFPEVFEVESYGILLDGYMDALKKDRDECRTHMRAWVAENFPEFAKKSTEAQPKAH